METINANRMNLLLKREEINTALTGTELLLHKKDVLLSEFFSCLKSLMLKRETLDNQAGRATASLVFALGLEGKEKLISFSFVAGKPPDFKFSYKNLWGVRIPDVVIQQPQANRREDSVDVETALSLQELKEDFQDFLNLALQILPQELKLKRLGAEIKRTTRKVNYLEKYVIPQLYSQIKFICESLEEREREDIFRLKRLKKKLIR